MTHTFPTRRSADFVTNRKFVVESLLRFGKKVSFPAILAVPLIGGALAVSWSAAETAQAEARPPVMSPADSVVTPAARPLEAGDPQKDATDADAPARTSAETRSEEHTSELQSLMRTSYAVFCLKKKKQ